MPIGNSAWGRGSFVGDAVAAIRLNDPEKWPEPPRHRGPVLVIPGFMAGDYSTARLRAWLRAGGADARPAGIRLNAGCMEPAIEHLERTVVELADGTGERVSVIGHSRGGNFGRILAVRRPEFVSTLVTLGTPVLDQLAFVNPFAFLGTFAVSVVVTLGVRGLITRSCLNGQCCARSRSELARVVPPGVRYTAIYSRRDGIVSWRACLARDATLVEISCQHMLMTVSPAIWRSLTSALEEPRGRDPAATAQS